MSDNPTPREAALVLATALANLDTLEPAAVREPVRDILMAGMEMCWRSRSLLGKPVNHTLALARVIVGVSAKPALITGSMHGINPEPNGE